MILFSKKMLFFNKKTAKLKKMVQIFGGFKKTTYLCTRKTRERKTIVIVAPVAQLVEHLTLNQGVQGSNPCGCTKQEK